MLTRFYIERERILFGEAASCQLDRHERDLSDELSACQPVKHVGMRETCWMRCPHVNPLNMIGRHETDLFFFKVDSDLSLDLVLKGLERASLGGHSEKRRKKDQGHNSCFVDSGLVVK